MDSIAKSLYRDRYNQREVGEMNLSFKMILNTKTANTEQKIVSKKSASQVTSWKMDLLNTKLK